MKIKRLIFFAALLLTVASGVWADPLPQAIWCSGNTTLYFTYDEPVGSSYCGQTVDRVFSGDSFYYGKLAEAPGISSTCTTVVFESSFASVLPTNCTNLFVNLGALTNIQGIENLNTSEVTSMGSMFAGCGKLTSLDLSHFNTASVTDMETMFKNCIKLTTLDLSSFDTSNVTTMSEMFSGCSALTTLTVASGWTKIANRANRFSNCSPSTIHLVMDDNGDNPSLLEEFGELISGKAVNVTLRNRILQKDGNWNTLCLPFNMTLTGSPLEGATLKELTASESSFDSNGKLTLTFVPATNIEVGKPYIIKWTSGSDNIVSPVFNGVTITSNTPTPVEFPNAVGANCQFVGQYAPFSITDDNKNKILMLSTGNRLGYSQNARTLRCFRAHFVIPTTTDAPAMTSYAIDFDGEEATDIISMHHSECIMHHEVYDLQGSKVDVQPYSQLKKGIYIINGKKVLIP